MEPHLARRPSWDRPKWAKDESTYEIHMRAERTHSPQQIQVDPPHDPESFSFDSKYLHLWIAPPTIMYRDAAFPAMMKIELDDWAQAGAAVCTALERIDILTKQAMYRGWPGKKGLANFSRQGSVGSPATAGASDFSMSPSPMASPYLLPVRGTSGLPANPDSQSKAGSQQLPSAIDSPLISPAGANTPARGIQDAKHGLPDLSQFPAELSPHLSSSMPGSGTQTPAAVFDENAWEVYIGNFHAELSDVRARALSRWKGFTRTIDRLHNEYRHMAEFQQAMGIFEVWWVQAKTEMGPYEERVKALRVPEVEQVKKQRLDLGLPM